MRFLLIIALALLPLSTAINCHDGEGVYEGTTLVEQKRNVSSCEQSTRFCYLAERIFHGKSSPPKLFMKCADNFCQKDGCGEVFDDKRRMTVNYCCCSTDLCNESLATAIKSIPLTSSIFNLESKISGLESKISDLASSNADLASAINRLASSISGPAPSNDTIEARL